MSIRHQIDMSWVLPNAEHPRTFHFVTLVLATYLTGFLSGLLHERLVRVSADLERRDGEIEALRNLNERILESLSSGLMTLNGEGEIIYANRAALEILGLELSPKGEHPEALGILMPKERLERRWECELVVGEETKVLGFSATDFILEGQSRGGELLSFQDLTELKKAERALERHDRLMVLGRFAASVAHEIRNPLASISGSVELLAEGGEPEDNQALSEIVLAEIDRLNGLLQKVLEYSVPRKLVRERVDLGAEVSECAKLFDNGVPANINHEYTTDDGIEVELDRESLRQVLLNLWRNAMEAQPEGGKIGTYVELENGMGVIRVCDSGPGIPEEEKTTVFEPFYSTKDKGTGLGLATVYQLVSENGGRIQLSTQKSCSGAEFVVTFPVLAGLEGE